MRTQIIRRLQLRTKGTINGLMDTRSYRTWRVSLICGLFEDEHSRFDLSRLYEVLSFAKG